MFQQVREIRDEESIERREQHVEVLTFTFNFTGTLSTRRTSPLLDGLREAP